MVTLNFPNGNVQTYPTIGDMQRAVKAMGGEWKNISGDIYVFIPKQ